MGKCGMERIRIFIAIATDGYILYSNDGFNWVESVLSGSLYGGCWSKELGIFVIVGFDIIYTSSLQNRKPTNENIFNSEFNSIDENVTWTFNALNTNSILLNGSSVSTLIGDKQDILTPTTNISISTTGDISCDLRGSTNIEITGGIIPAVNLATTTQLGNKQDEIKTTTDLTCNTLNATTITGTNLSYGTTDVETVITGLQNNKQDDIISTTDLTCNELTTAGNVSIGGVITAPNQIGFLAYSKSASNVSGSNTQKLPYNEVKYNICGHYDTSTYIFTAPVVGIYIFYATYFTVDGQGGTVDLIKKVGTVEFTISRNQEGNNSPGNNEVRRFMIIIDCNAGDQLYALMRNSVIRLSSLNISDDTMFGPYGVQLLS